MLKKFVASLLSLIFVVTAVPFFFVTGFYFIFADEDFYGDKLVESVYQFLVEELPRFVNLEKFPTLNEEDFSQLIASVISKEDLSFTVKSVVEQIREQEIEEGGRLRFSIPIDWLSGKRGELAENVAEILVQDLPKCENGFEELINEEGTISCIPLEFSETDFKVQVQSMLANKVFSEIPGSLDFDAQVPFDFDGKVGDFWNRMVGLFLIAGLVVLAFILLLMWLVIFKPFVLVLKYWARTLFFSALFLCLILASFIFLPAFVIKTVQDKSAEMIFSVIDVIFGDVARIMIIYSLIGLVVSLALWILARVMCRKIMKGEVLRGPLG